MSKNHFCLIWKSNDISFNKATEELKLNFKVVDNVFSDEHVKSFNKYEYKTRKVQSQLTNLVAYDIEIFSTDRAVPYADSIYRLSTKSGKFNRDITQREFEKCKKMYCFQRNI